MSFFSNYHVGVTLQDNTLVICEIRRNDYYKTVAEIQALSAQAIPKEVYLAGKILDAEKLKELIRDALKNAKPEKISSREIIFEIPEEHTFHQLFELPKETPEDQITEVALAEAEKVLPFSIEQVSWDIRVIGNVGKSLSVIFSAAPLDLVQEYYDFFLKCDLQPIGFSVRLENLLNAIGRKRPTRSILLDLQDEYTSVMLLEEKQILALRQINIGELTLKKAIQQHYDLEEKNLEKHLKKISTVDINLATLHQMLSFQEQLDAIILEFEKKEKEFQRQQKKLEPAVPAPTKIQKLPEEKKKDPIVEVPEKFSFLFVGNTLFHYAIRNFFHQHKNPKLSPLEGNVKNLLNISVKNQGLLHFFEAEEEKETKEKKKIKKGDNAPKQVLFEKTIIQKLIPSAIGSAMSDYSEDEKGKRPINLLPPLVRAIAIWKKTSAWFYVMATIMLLFSVVWLMAFGFTWGTTLAQLRVSQQNFTLVERTFDTTKPITLEQKITTANEELQTLTTLKKTKLLYSHVIDQILTALPEPVTAKAFQYGLSNDKTLFEIKATSGKREEIIQTYQAVKELPFVKSVYFPASNFNEKDEIEFSILFTVTKAIATPSP